jgi:hypothetical protein
MIKTLKCLIGATVLVILTLLVIILDAALSVLDALRDGAQRVGEALIDWVEGND